MIDGIIGFVIGLSITIIPGLIIYWYKYVKKDDTSYLLEFEKKELLR